jgi:hypothetical protein
MGSGGGGSDEAFEDSLGDFDEAVAGGGPGGGGEEEIDILSPTGSGSSGVPTNEPLFEEGDEGGEGDMAENQAVAQRAASGASNSSSSSSSDGQQSSSSGSQSGDQQSQDQTSEAAGGLSGGGGAGAQEANREVGDSSTSGAEESEEEIVAIPEDIGDGRNDDIVLRQIREAAMNESDPVLREKLWDEYRRIRGSR